MAFKPSLRLVAAGAVAVVADLIEVALFPITAEGILSPVADVLDVVVAAIMVALLGWHWAFMPSIMGKVIPGVDLVPFWTMAVFIVGMGEQQKQSGQQMPGIPAVPPPMPYMIPPNGAAPQKELTVQATPAAPAAQQQH